MQQEEILAAVVGRFGWPGIKKINMPIAWATPKEGQTGGMNVLALAKGAKQSDLALKFIDYWLSAEVQQKIVGEARRQPGECRRQARPGHRRRADLWRRHRRCHPLRPGRGPAPATARPG